MWLDIAGLAITAIGSAAPFVKEALQSHPGLIDRMEGCYVRALKQWCPNNEIRDHWSTKIPTANAFVARLQECGDKETELHSLLSIWVDKMRGDEVCNPFFLEAEFEGQTIAILQAIKAPYNSIYEASSILRAYYNEIIPGYHIDRYETRLLYGWIKADVDEKPENRIAVLLAGAGSGKTVVMHDLLEMLEDDGTPVLGIKSDSLFFSSEASLDDALNLGEPVTRIVKDIASKQQIVVLIDQIDALSSTLSSDRRPLETINAFISEITEVPNVRVIVSCRQYDFDYESAFARYKQCKKINIDALSYDNVKNVLAEAGIQADRISDTVIEFLRTPLYLFLYCRLADQSNVNETTTLQELYGSLWKEFIVDKAGASTKDLVECLDIVARMMSERQVLIVDSALLSSEYAHQLNYLVSNRLMTKTKTNKIQFIHQTLFEYVTARLFVEKKRTIASAFANIHQGLFIRPQLKQILDYQRGVDPQTYISNLREILFSKTEKGYDKYRLHLKQLVITTFAYNPSFLPGEKVIFRQLLDDTQLKSVLLSAVTNKDGIDLLSEYIEEHGGATKVDIAYVRSYLNAIVYLSRDDTAKAAHYLTKISEIYADNKLRQQFLWTLDAIPVNEDNLPVVWGLIKNYGATGGDIEILGLLERIIDISSSQVGDYLVDYLDNYLNIRGKRNVWHIDVPRNFKIIVEMLEEKQPKAFLFSGLRMLDLILTSSEEFNDDEIQSSTIFSLYNRHNSPIYFDDWLLTHLIETIEKEIEKNDADIDNILNELASSNEAAKHVMAISGWLSSVDRYTKESYQYLASHIGKQFHSSYLEYCQKKLFEALFTKLEKEKKDVLMEKVANLAPDWEKMPLSKGNNTPHLRIGYTKAQYYSLIPENILKDEYPEAWQEYNRLRRQYNNIEIVEPNRIRTMSGWSATPQSAVDMMSKEDLINHALKYDKDDPLDWSIPTRHDNASVYAARAAKEPDFMCDVYSSMIDIDSSLNYYVSYGLESLYDGGCSEEKMCNLLTKLIKSFPDDVNVIDHTVLMRVFHYSRHFSESRTTPPAFLFDFICKVAIYYEDEDDSTKEQVDINDGINQVRGSAVDHLIPFYYCEDCSDRIFEVLETVAKNGNVATRCAALFNMALLIHVDEEKTFNLFMKMVSRDYNVNLLRIPLHNLNPLLYFIRTRFEELKPYFEECIKQPSTHSVNVVLLFAAWLRESAGAEDMTLHMADLSKEGKCQLIRDIRYSYKPQYHDKCMKVLLRYLNFDDQNLGMAYDALGDILKQWSRQSLKQYLPLYCSSAVGCYARHDMIKFLKGQSLTFPEDCLIWIRVLYGNQKKNADRFQISELTQILIEAYNNIFKFDKQNSALESAMDMFDELIRSNSENMNLNRYLKEVS